MTNCATIYAKDYATKEEAFAALKEYFDKGIGCAYDSSGADKEDTQWVLKELSAYTFFARTNWDLTCDHSLSWSVAGLIPDSLGGAKAYMKNVLEGHSLENCKAIIRQKAKE